MQTWTMKNTHTQATKILGQLIEYIRIEIYLIHKDCYQIL